MSENRSTYLVKVKGQEPFHVKDVSIGKLMESTAVFHDMSGGCAAIVPISELEYAVALQHHATVEKSVRKTLAEYQQG